MRVRPFNDPGIKFSRHTVRQAATDHDAVCDRQGILISIEHPGQVIR